MDRRTPPPPTRSLRAPASLPARRAHRPRGWVFGGAALLLAAALALLQPGAVRAQALEVGAPVVASSDPQSITFGLRVTAPAGLDAAMLRYRVVNPTGAAVGGRAAATVGPARTHDLRVTVETRAPTRYIPVGSRIRYFWELTGGGETLRTAEEEFVFLDGRFSWRTIVDGDVTAYYYDSERVAQEVVAGTRDAIGQVSALLGVEVDYPVRVLIWASIEDGQDVLRPGQQGRTEFTRLGGQRVAPDLLYLFDSQIDTARHEAAHIVTHVAGDGTLTGVPSWLDEGTAVNAQTLIDASYVSSLAAAIDRDDTLSLRSITTPPGDNSRTLLFYGQSAATVRWLVDEYGEASFAALFAEIRGGAPIDEALDTIYGFNQDGVYNGWRASVGLAPVAVAETRPRDVPVAEATRGPLALPPGAGGTAGGGGDGAADGAAGDEGAADAAGAADDGGDTTTAAVVAAAALVLAAALGGGAMFVLRRSRRAA